MSETELNNKMVFSNYFEFIKERADHFGISLSEAIAISKVISIDENTVELRGIVESIDMIDFPSSYDDSDLCNAIGSLESVLKKTLLGIEDAICRND